MVRSIKKSFILQEVKKLSNHVFISARKADVDAVDKDQYTALHAASASGASIIVQQLLEANADVLAPNSFGNTPVHTACLNGHGDVLNILLSVLAEQKENVFDLLNSNDQSPLHLAAASPSADRCFDSLMQEPLAGNICAIYVSKYQAQSTLMKY